MTRLINFISGFFIGTVVGAVSIILTTPQSGDIFQDNVRSLFDRMMQEARQAASVKRSELEAQLAALKEN